MSKWGSKSIRERKREHIEICLKEYVDSRTVSTGFEDVVLVHKALPEVDYDEVDTRVEFLGHELSAPLLIDAISGGIEDAYVLNSNLASIAQELNLGMVVGSQRIALESPGAKESFRVVRERAPNSLIIANIGIAQLISGGVDLAKECVEMVRANALSIHLNPLQELLQAEGDRKFKGGLEVIKRAVEELDVPVIVKETGAGISPEVARKLEGVGVAAINVSGVGGTSWAAVEHYRNLRRGNKLLALIAETFWDWGLPTAFLVKVISETVKIPVVASGGVRTGIDVAKAIAMGASLASMARPLLAPALKGKEELKLYLNRVIEELKTAMFLSGAVNVERLKEAKLLITGRLRDLLEAWKVVE